jgi:hypothetical protein
MFQHVDGYSYSQLDFTIFERILRLKPWHRFTAAKAAAAFIPMSKASGFPPVFR